MVKSLVQLIIFTLILPHAFCISYEITPRPLIVGQKAQLIVNCKGVSTPTIINKASIKGVNWNRSHTTRLKDRYGKTEQTTRSYTFTPENAGTLNIPELKVKAGNNSYSYTAQSIRVHPALDTESILSDNITTDISLQPKKSTIYTGEIITCKATLNLDSQLKAEKLSLDSITSEMAEIITFTMQPATNNQLCADITIRPIKPVPLSLYFNISGSISVPLLRNKKHLTIDKRFLAGYERPFAKRRALSFKSTIHSDIEVLSIKQMPKGTLHGVSDIIYSLNKTSFKLNEPIILKAVLTGTQLYPQNLIMTPKVEGFTVYKPHCTLTGQNVTGNKAILEWIVTPHNQGKQIINTMLVSFNSGITKQYPFSSEITITNTSVSNVKKQIGHYRTIYAGLFLVIINVTLLITWAQLLRNKAAIKPLKSMLSIYSKKRRLLKALVSSDDLQKELVLESLEYLQTLNNFPPGTTLENIIFNCGGTNNLVANINDTLYSPLSMPYSDELRTLLIKEIKRI